MCILKSAIIPGYIPIFHRSLMHKYLMNRQEVLMNWLEVTVDAQPGKLDELCERLETLGIDGLIVEDEAFVRDFVKTECNTWEHIEEDVFESVLGMCRVRFFLEDSDEGVAELHEISSALDQTAFTVKTVKDEDWENNWRQYYKPIASGERLVIVPAWEAVPEELTDRVAVYLDPKKAFGNGTHASTSLCLEMLEHYTPTHVLDIGCGSGILSIAALMLGAKTAIGCDIVSKTAEIVSENAVINGLAPDAIPVYNGDILTDTELKSVLGKSVYDLIFANIVADVIIPLIPVAAPLLAPGGVLICSGIYDGRQGGVLTALTECGLYIAEAHKTENWHALACKRR